MNVLRLKQHLLIPVSALGEMAARGSRGVARHAPESKEWMRDAYTAEI